MEEDPRLPSKWHWGSKVRTEQMRNSGYLLFQRERWKYRLQYCLPHVSVQIEAWLCHSKHMNCENWSRDKKSSNFDYNYLKMYVVMIAVAKPILGMLI